MYVSVYNVKIEYKTMVKYRYTRKLKTEYLKDCTKEKLMEKIHQDINILSIGKVIFF